MNSLGIWKLSEIISLKYLGIQNFNFTQLNENSLAFEDHIFFFSNNCGKEGGSNKTALGGSPYEQSGSGFQFLIPGVNQAKAGWWFGTFYIFPLILGMSSSQLTKSYFSEWWPNHQPEKGLNQFKGGCFTQIDGFFHHVLGFFNQTYGFSLKKRYKRAYLLNPVKEHVSPLLESCFLPYGGFLKCWYPKWMGGWVI